ncbi:hypothetical protein Agabi119p4_5037 [Agaricus bisporus var. burnettii]|uniref:Uncharacterized protein n=1 Tax=Agaricus bisporus var. burnettii TaxID=192524 RepID=A0A8H7F4F9_AGABI|nr:hypothetical protein Agabi119p4_5037 [Agaricus bisporus var. burnettii]
MTREQQFKTENSNPHPVRYLNPQTWLRDLGLHIYQRKGQTHRFLDLLVAATSPPTTSIVVAQIGIVSIVVVASSLATVGRGRGSRVPEPVDRGSDHSFTFSRRRQQSFLF